MRLSRNPFVSLLITASIIIAGLTVFFLAVQGRPDGSADLVAEANAAQQEANALQEQPIATADPAAATGVAVVEGEPIILNPQPGELIQRADTLPIPIIQEPVPTATAEVVSLEPTAAGDAGIVPTLTPIPQPTQAPLPTNTPVVVQADGQVTSQVNTGVSPIIYLSHTVSAGETLYSISRLYNSAVELLAQEGISSSDLIPGAVISVPAPNAAYCPNMRTYVVREKDTVFRIAAAYGVTIEQVRLANPPMGGDYAIDLAQVLCIPN